MNSLIVKNDLKRNKLINASLLLFITISAILATMSVIIGIQTVTSITNFFEAAKPPHFLQMHKGNLDEDKLASFMNTNDTVTDWQVQSMLGVFGDQISISSNDDAYTMSDLRLDVSLVKQNDEKDILLDSNHEKVQLSPGEIGMPVLLKNRYNLQLGDHIEIAGQPFTIAEFVLDAQMNSPMTSSTRILLSDTDYKTMLAENLEKEYLIEAYFNQTDEAATFQTAYEDADLPMNGPTITYTIIFLLSALTDIAIVFVLLIVSLLLILIAFICLKYTIMATLEEEVREIGTMKAIGLSNKDINSIYLTKYRFLAVIGVTAGLLISLATSGFFTDHISATFGASGLSTFALIFSILAAVMVYIMIILYSKKIVNNIRHLTVVEALTSNNGFDKNKTKVKDGLYKAKSRSVNWLLASRELLHQSRKWAMIFFIMLLAIVMVLVPLNLLSTMRSPEFVTYMGSPHRDILIEIDNSQQMDENFNKTLALLNDDPTVANMQVAKRVSVQTTDAENDLFNLHVDTGANAGEGLQYLDGVAPQTQDEIAISYLNAQRTEKTSGDTIFLNGEPFTVSGIYQDVTNGGYSAKNINEFTALPISHYQISVDLIDGTNSDEKAAEWANTIKSGVSIDSMQTFIDQTLGGVAEQLQAVAGVITLIGAGMVALITGLFLKLRLAQNAAEMAILTAIGFSKKDMTKQYLMKMGLVASIGVAFGTILTGLFGETALNFALSFTGLGIKQVDFIINPWVNYLLVPVVFTSLTLAVTWTMLETRKKQTIVSIINE